MIRRLLFMLLLIASLACTACATKSADTISSPAEQVIQTEAEEDNSLDDYDEEDTVVQSDPLEGWNRFWFDFNDWFIQNLLKPIHKGYAFIVPETMRSGINNFAYNIVFPVRMLNSLLQGEFAQAGVEFDRSLVNFMTSLGFADVASQSKPLFPYHPETETLDYTLGKWGVADGPYFILPFLGPSTVRGAVGFAGDSVLKPQNYLVDWPLSLGSSALFTVNSADELYKPYDQITQSALEPYVALRNAYMNLRLQMQERIEADAD